MVYFVSLSKELAMKKIMYLFCFLFVVINPVHAAEPNGSYVDYKLKVTAIVSMQSGAYVYFDTNHQCGAKRAYIDQARTDIYTTLLTAKATNSFVSVDLRETTLGGSCNNNQSVIGNLCMGDESSPCFTGW